MTVHRPQNTDNSKNLRSIVKALAGEKVVFPLHPRTVRKKINFSNIIVIDPVDYMEILALEKNAKKVITDSGGIQKEAFWFKVPCITLRDSIEWPEVLKKSWNILVGADKNKIIRVVKKPLPRSYSNDCFGNRKVAQKIVKHLVEIYGK